MKRILPMRPEKIKTDTVPVTFWHGWKNLAEADRLVAMREFAANGAFHLMLSNQMLKMMCGDFALAGILKKQAKAAGVDFVDAHAPFGEFGDLFIPDPREHREMIARHKLNLLLVESFGVNTCAFHVGSKYRPDHSPEEHRDALFRSLDELLPLAEKLHMTMCLENLRGPLNTAADLISYLEKYPSPYLGVCFDSGHANLKETGQAFPESDTLTSWNNAGLEVCWEHDIVETLCPYIVNCHIHDNHGAADEHLLPGAGNIDWKRIVSVLTAAPRLRCIQCEVHTGHYGIPIREVTTKMFNLFGRRSRS